MIDVGTRFGAEAIARAQCSLKLREWKRASYSCTKVLNRRALASDASRLKALFRRGSASIKLELWAAARSDLKEACALDPKSQDYCIIEVNPRLSRSSALASKKGGCRMAAGKTISLKAGL